MAYEPKTWVCDEDITDEALNHMEQGIANASGSGVSLVEFCHLVQTGFPQGDDSIVLSTGYPPPLIDGASAGIQAIMDSGKKLIGFVADVTNSNFSLVGLKYNHKDMVIHQSEEGYFEPTSYDKELQWTFIRRYPGSNPPAMTFDATIYAILI